MNGTIRNQLLTWQHCFTTWPVTWSPQLCHVYLCTAVFSASRRFNRSIQNRLPVVKLASAEQRSVDGSLASRLSGVVRWLDSWLMMVNVTLIITTLHIYLDSGLVGNHWAAWGQRSTKSLGCTIHGFVFCVQLLLLLLTELYKSFSRSCVPASWLGFVWWNAV